MNKRFIFIVLTLIFVFLLVHHSNCLAQTPDDWENQDPGGDVPIPGILYFLVALLGIGIKKIYNARKKD